MTSRFPASPTQGLPVCQADPGVRDCARVVLDRSVTVAMSAYGNASIALIALRALFNAASGDFELILVDDCSRDEGAVRDLFLQTRSEHANTQVYRFDRNLEYSGSLNCILSHAKGAYVLFLSNDIFVTPAYLRQVLAVARQDPSHGIVRGCSNFVDNGSLLHNVEVPNLVTLSDLFAFGDQIERQHGGQVAFDPYLTGDAFLVSRQVIDAIGTFDPLFYGYFADPDYGIRAQCAGFKLALARGAFAYHSRDANINSLPQAQAEAKLRRRRNRVLENWARFKLKYGLPVEDAFEGNIFDTLPWDAFNSAPFTDKQHVSAMDYSRFLMT